MKTTINFCEFTDAFKAISPDNFTYSGLKALYEYLEEYEESTGEEIELDVIALCCDYSEYESLQEAYEEYNDDDEEGSTGEEMQDYFEENTQIITFDEGVIIQAF